MKCLRNMVLLSLLFLMGSCANSLSRKVAIESVDNVSLMGFSAAKATVTFSNKSARNIVLSDVTISLMQAGRAVATLELKDDVEIARRSESLEVPTIWRLSNVDAIAALSLVKNIERSNFSSLNFDVSASVKAGLLKRRVELKNISLDQMVNTLKMNNQK